jgi:hypothetical protein
MSVRVLVCGGRDYDGRKVVGACLRGVHERLGIALVVTGDAPGADRLAKCWADRNHIPVCLYPANWRFLGKRAGPTRNAAMLQFSSPDLVVAFPGGRGTQNMIAQARAAGVEVRLSSDWANPPAASQETV